MLTIQATRGAHYFSTHGGAGPLRSSFARELEGFLVSPGPNFPVFKKACITFPTANFSKQSSSQVSVKNTFENLSI